MVFESPVQPWLVKPSLSDGIYACLVRSLFAKHDSLRSRKLVGWEEGKMYKISYSFKVSGKSLFESVALALHAFPY